MRAMTSRLSLDPTQYRHVIALRLRQADPNFSHSAPNRICKPLPLGRQRNRARRAMEE